MEAQKFCKKFASPNQYRVFARILNLYRQIHAVDHAIKVLSSNEQIIFVETIKYLEKKKSEFRERISQIDIRKIREIVELYNKLCGIVEKIEEEVKVRVDEVDVHK